VSVTVILVVFNCRHDGTIKHFKITQTAQPSGTVYILDRQFQTLEDLVEFYSDHDVPNVEAIAGVRLTVPIVGSADETSSSQEDGILRQRRARRVSADDAPGNKDASELGHTKCSSKTLQHSISESKSDDALLSKRRSWRRKIFDPLKPSNEKSRTDTLNRSVQSVTVRSVTAQVSCTVISSTRQSNSSFSETPKKYHKQPAIPDDDSGGPALASMPTNSAQSNALFASGADELAAAAANYNVAATDADAGLYYSEPRDVDRELSTDFIASLLQQDKEDHSDGKCVCGLYVVESELPHGWSMHISTESGTQGQLFFTSPTGETSWELPTRVSVDLDTEQQDRIRQLIIRGQRAARQVSSQQVSVSRQLSDSEKGISV